MLGATPAGVNKLLLRLMASWLFIYEKIKARSDAERFFCRHFMSERRLATLCLVALIGTSFPASHLPRVGSFISAAEAQTLTDKFGGFSTNSNAPINIEADLLKVNDKKKTAVFSGNVKAAQGDFVLRSKQLEVFYVGGPSAKGAGGKVSKLKAAGGVLISTKDDQSATSQWADFDVVKQVIVLGDTVVLTQGGNVIRGGRLIIDLKTRTSRFDNTKKKKGRVQMKVDVSGQKKK